LKFSEKQKSKLTLARLSFYTHAGRSLESIERTELSDLYKAKN